MATPYDNEARLIYKYLKGKIPDEHLDILCRLLVVGMNWGAGDALAGLMLMKLPKDKIREAILKVFPTFEVKEYWSNEGLMLNLFSHRTGDAVMDKILEALDKASTGGTGNLSDWLKEVGLE